MCTHRVNFYLQYTIYNLLYLISSSEEHYTFCFTNSGTHSNFSGSRYVKRAPAYANWQYILSTRSKGKKQQMKNVSNVHTFLASWILECGELKSTSRFVCFIYCTGSDSGTCNANSLVTSSLLRKAVRLWWIPSGTHKES